MASIADLAYGAMFGLYMLMRSIKLLGVYMGTIKKKCEYIVRFAL